MWVTMEPLADRIIVEVIRTEEVTAGGVVLPEQARERSQRGRVLAVGPGRWEAGQLVPVMVERGETVLFSKYGGTELPEGGERRLVLREADVLSVEKRWEDEAAALEYQELNPCSDPVEELTHEEAAERMRAAIDRPSQQEDEAFAEMESRQAPVPDRPRCEGCGVPLDMRDVEHADDCPVLAQAHEGKLPRSPFGDEL